VKTAALSHLAEAPVGAHLVTPRRGYTHHGIYVGGGRVVHYSGSSRAFHYGPVEEVTLETFARGRPVEARASAGRYSGEEVARCARSRLGEHRYGILRNNCEHFVAWCADGTPRSEQVECWVARASRLVRAIGLSVDVRVQPLES
jgi:hypothetical protein